MDNKNKEPGYLVGLWVSRILWLIIIMCLLALGTAIVAGVIRLLIWYMTLIF